MVIHAHICFYALLIAFDIWNSSNDPSNLGFGWDHIGLTSVTSEQHKGGDWLL